MTEYKYRQWWYKKKDVESGTSDSELSTHLKKINPGVERIIFFDARPTPTDFFFVLVTEKLTDEEQSSANRPPVEPVKSETEEKVVLTRSELNKLVEQARMWPDKEGSR